MTKRRSRKNPHAVTLGRKGGLAGKGRTSVAKAAAARRNGKKGGRTTKIPKMMTLAFATRMIADPRRVVESMASSNAFAHLGSAGPDLIAQAFGFDSIADCDVKRDQANREMAELQRRQR